MAGQSEYVIAWLKSSGIHWDEFLVEIRPVDGGLGVFAVQALCDGQRLCEIPKKAVLSVRNTGIADILEQHMIRGGLGLIIAIMYELSIGKKSFWHGYLSALGQREHLPLFWGEQERALLQGTEAEHRPQEDEELTQEDFETNVLPLVEQHSDRLAAAAFTLDNFRKAASWVASRAFGVDSCHGMSMVPLADIFNHKAAIVQLSDDYMIEPACYEEDDSSEVGSSIESETSEDKEPEDYAGIPQQNGQGDESERLEDKRAAPAVTRGYMLRMSGASTDQYRLEIGICGATRNNGEEVLEIIAASTLPKGQEVHNTYGELGNAELVVKYGFALRDNPFDAVLLDKQEVVEEARRISGDRASRQRCRFLSRESELLEEDREPFEVLPGGCIGPSLLVALRVLLASDAEFHSWNSLDDALQLCTLQPQQHASADRQQKAGSGHKSNEESNLRCGHASSRKRVADESTTGQVSEGPELKKHCSEASRYADSTGKGGTVATNSRAAEFDGACRNGDCVPDGAATETAEEQQVQVGNTSIRTAAPRTVTSDMRSALRECIQLRLQRYRHADMAIHLRELEAEEGVNQQRGSRTEISRARLAALRLVLAEKGLLHAALNALE